MSKAATKETKKMSRRLILLAVSLAALLAPGAATAAAAPVWNLEIHHNQTNFPPGGEAEYWFDLANVGGEDSSGPVTLRIGLPGGLSGDSVRVQKSYGVEWSCPGVAGASIITCTTEEAIGRHTVDRSLALVVDVSPSASGDRFATAKVEGGGAAAETAFEKTHISATPAPFGIVEDSFVADFYERDGLTPERGSGTHPDLASFAFDFTSVAAPTAEKPHQKAAAGSVRDLRVDLPRGFLGNPTAVGECTPADLSFSTCPRSSQVGRADLTVYPVAAEDSQPLSVGVFNMTHPRGSVADLAFTFASLPVHVKASLDSANGYAVKTEVSDINESLPPFSSKVTIWGVPADPSHDSERCHGVGSEGLEPADDCPTDAQVRPFLTVPFDCEAEDNAIVLRDYDSWQESGAFGPDVPSELPGRFEECEKPRFEPQMEIEPTGDEAATPTGLDVRVEVPQNENPVASATPPVKSAVVTLPEGMAVNPAFADGLEGCAPAEIGLGSDDPVTCPDSSRIGAVELSTPLLPQPLEGSMYLARQHDNPYGTLLALYLVLHDTEERGVLVKVPGRIDLDAATGQITTSFDDLPQFPFDGLTLGFRSGPRAPLVNPPTCGTHVIRATMASYARPDEPVDVSSTYSVGKGPGGGACQNDLGARPFAPALLAGSLNPVAGAFSPLELRVSRSDADQELSTVEGVAPAGLVASLKGVGRCSDAQIAAAAARSNPGEGALEQASPSCPADSQVGTVDAGAGAGPSPIYVPGKIYLAGPYEGAPLSGVAIVPAVAGPVDLGNVVVRAPAYVDPRSARIRIASDPLPQVVNGVLIRTRDVRIHLDRSRFTLNPTSCEPTSVDATLRSSEGAVSEVSSRFQVGSCASLGFKPRLDLRLVGGAKRGGHPALHGVFRPRQGDSNLQRLVLRLPHSAFLDQAHIRTICTRVQFAANGGNGGGCPKAAVYGKAKAWTPLLDEPLEGPVYLRSSNHNLPDLVTALHGTLDVEAVARIDSKNGGIRAIFSAVPDAPLSRVVVDMQGGKKGLIVNSKNLCRKPGRNRADARYSAHNGRQASGKPRLRAVNCKKARSSRRHGRHHRRGG